MCTWWIHSHTNPLIMLFVFNEKWVKWKEWLYSHNDLLVTIRKVKSKEDKEKNELTFIHWLFVMVTDKNLSDPVVSCANNVLLLHPKGCCSCLDSSHCGVWQWTWPRHQRGLSRTVWCHPDACKWAFHTCRSCAPALCSLLSPRNLIIICLMRNFHIVGVMRNFTIICIMGNFVNQ